MALAGQASLLEVNVNTMEITIVLTAASIMLASGPIWFIVRRELQIRRVNRMIRSVLEGNHGR